MTGDLSIEVWQMIIFSDRMKNGFINDNYSTIPDNSTTRILDASDSISFHSSLHGYTPTPLYNLPELSRQYKVSNIYLKDESHRFGLNSFKTLGASYAVNKLISNNQAFDTLCTATEGNHGRALAWLARIFDKKCVVFIPWDTAAGRINTIENCNNAEEKRRNPSPVPGFFFFSFLAIGLLSSDLATIVSMMEPAGLAAS